MHHYYTMTSLVPRCQWPRGKSRVLLHE